MNFLQLCQRVRQECGISGTGPASVNNQIGENKRIVDWVASAYEDLQMKHTDWYWMRGNFTLTTAPGVAGYSAIDARITDFAQWDNETIRLYSATETEANARFLHFMPYLTYVKSNMTMADQANRPSYFTIMPDMKLQLAPKPNAVYTVKGDYFKTPVTLSATLDTPALPARFHMAIVYRAMMMYARYEAAGEIYADAEANYRRYVNMIELNQLPTMEMAQPLA